MSASLGETSRALGYLDILFVSCTTARPVFCADQWIAGKLQRVSPTLRTIHAYLLNSSRIGKEAFLCLRLLAHCPSHSCIETTTLDRDHGLHLLCSWISNMATSRVMPCLPVPATSRDDNDETATSIAAACTSIRNPCLATATRRAGGCRPLRRSPRAL